jgi:hypothetical protein
MLSYVGQGHHLFVALVSKLWKESYSTLQSQQLTVSKMSRKTRISCMLKMTWFSSVFASPSRVELAHESGCTPYKYQRVCLRAAGKHGDIATLAAAHKLGMKYTGTTMAAAGQCNKLAEVQYLHDQGCPWSRGLLLRAARDGYFELLRWCYEHGCVWQNTADAPYYAAQSGNVELMAWVLQLPGMRVYITSIAAAAAKGHVAMCKYLHELQCPWHSSATQQAAAGGHVDLLTWLVDNGCRWETRQLCTAAAECGSIEVLTYLQQQGLLTSRALLTDMLDTAAAVRNELAAAKWLREQGAEWPTSFLSYRHPWHSDVLEWARAEGCTTVMHVF